MHKYWFFESVNLFQLLCPHKFKAYAESHKFIECKKDEYIYIQGDRSKTMFLINAGKVKIGFWDERGNEIVTSYLKKGEIFGEEVVINAEDKRKEFAQACDSSTSLCSVTATQIEELVRDNKAFSTGLYKFIGYRFKRIERRYKIMFFRNTKLRILEFIKDLKEDSMLKNDISNEEYYVPNPYSQTEMAKLVATSRQTLNSLLKDLENEGYLEWKKNKILLKDRFLSEF